MRPFLMLIMFAALIMGCQSGSPTNNPDLYYKQGAVQCDSTKAQAEGFC